MTKNNSEHKFHIIFKKKDNWLKFNKSKKKEEQRKIKESIKLSRKIKVKNSDEDEDVDIVSFNIVNQPDNDSDLLAELFGDEQ